MVPVTSRPCRAGGASSSLPVLVLSSINTLVDLIIGWGNPKFSMTTVQRSHGDSRSDSAAAAAAAAAAAEEDHVMAGPGRTGPGRAADAGPGVAASAATARI